MIKMDEKLKEMITDTHKESTNFMQGINESLKKESIKNKNTGLHENLKISVIDIEENSGNNNIKNKNTLTLSNQLDSNVLENNDLKEELKEDISVKSTFTSHK